MEKKYRLVTRSDFDGLVCAVLLKEMDMINEIKFVHPKDMQDGLIEITDRDITTNLPYVPGCYLAFDHHYSETLRLKEDEIGNLVIDPDAPSAARVVHKYFGGKSEFPRVSDEMMCAVDQADAAQFSREEVLNPSDWVLLNFIMDSRTGLGRFHDFRVSNYQLMMDLIDKCRDMPIAEILDLPDVRERTELYFDHAERFQEQVQRCATIHKNLVVLDLRDEKTIYSGNRFMIYAIYPQCNISIHVMWGKNNQNTVFAIGKSILDRSSATDIGELCLAYGGGGHHAAGTCQVDHVQAANTLNELIAKITRDG
jgi:nanoRNase/pAp phosphatase (c-di-AMP/oligoRNAs hydrolase)